MFVVLLIILLTVVPPLLMMGACWLIVVALEPDSKARLFFRGLAAGTTSRHAVARLDQEYDALLSAHESR